MMVLYMIYIYLKDPDLLNIYDFADLIIIEFIRIVIISTKYAFFSK